MNVSKTSYGRYAVLRALKRAHNSSDFSRRHSSMMAWKVHDSMNNPYDADIRSKLKCSQSKLPVISLPSDVLVKVHATSVNPLDIRMIYGYGRKVLDILDIITNFEPRITNDRYPLTLGRDFSGEVVATGPNVTRYKPGDLVFGAIEPQKSGAHAEFVTASSCCLAHKPDNLTHQQAASVPFGALTAYSALSTFGNLGQSSSLGKQVLVLGGSGGVGSLAIQLARHWGATVTTTCHADKVQWLEEELKVDKAIDYNDLDEMLRLRGNFDFVLDCGVYDEVTQSRESVVGNNLEYLRPMRQSVYVTLSPPVLKNTDEEGIVVGGVKTAIDVVSDTIQGLRNGNSARWAFFLPNKNALEYVANLLCSEQLVPQVSSVFPFGQMIEAYEHLQEGKARGKVVVDVTDKTSASTVGDTGDSETKQH